MMRRLPIPGRLLPLVAILLLPLAALAQPYDVLIRNGRVVDGAGNPWFYGDVGVRGDRIVFVGKAPATAAARRTIDASGLVVAPGFIDMLGQSEFKLLVDKRAMSKLTQGITTEVTGEGSSVAPMSDAIITEMRDYLTHYGLTVDWRTLDQYFRRLERQGAGVNLATFVGAAQVRELVLGNADRAPTSAELARMQEAVARAMEHGAVGLSSSLIYAPGNFASTEELIALARVAAAHGGLYATHVRNESGAQMEALEEALRIGREAGLPVHIWHLKNAGRQNWGRMKDLLAAIEKAREAGLDVTADQYPYVASATSLGAAIPPRFHEGGKEALLARLKDPAQRAAIRKAMETPPSKGEENMWLGPGGPEGILVTDVYAPELKALEGKTIAQIAKLQGKDPLEALLDLVHADRNNVGAVYFQMDEAEVRLAMQKPWVAVDTDYGAVATDGLLGKSRTHPRAWGAFPRVLGKYVREERLLRLEDAIRKLTSLPAQRVRLVDRGLLHPGYFADITIFDPGRVADVATFEDPNRPSVGIEYVLVNGVLSLEKGKLTGRLGGRPLRGPGYKAR